MKSNKLLKVLSAATIISTLAVVENFTQGNTTFAIENNAIAAKDIKNLPDGEYNITVEALKFYGPDGQPSMAGAGLDSTNTKLIVQNGQYFVNVSFKPIEFIGKFGYLGNLKYYDGNKTHANRSSIQDNEFNPAAIVEYYSASETDDYVKTYKKKFPERTAYPKTLSYSVDKNKIDSNNKLETFTEVFVPVMEAISPKSGTQRMILEFDLSNALNTVADTQPTPAKPAVNESPVKPETPKNTQPSGKPTEPTATKSSDKPSYSGTTKPAKPVKPVETPKPKEQPKPVVTTPTPKPTPSATATYYKGVKATLLNAYRPGQKSMGDAALEHSNVTVFKEGSTYHYIVRFHDLSTLGFTGGISRFWVNGTEYTVNPTGESNNQVEVHFTSTEKLTSVPVSVFVQVMEDIMPGGGRQDATLAFDWSSVSEQQGQPIAGGTPGSTSGYTPQPAKTGKDTGKKSPTSPIKPVAKPNLPLQDQAQGQGVEVPVTFYDNVTASLLNAYESGRASMGNAALDGITVFKHGDTYHYKVRFHDIKVGTLTDGITRFWVNGTEYPVNKTGGAMNQVEIHFTSNEKLTNIPVSVFVPTMESIMPGAGKKDAILSLNWSNATERQGTAVIDSGQPGASAAGNGAGALTPKGGRLNNGRLSNTGLETSSSILAGALTLMSAFMVGRRKQK
ncbi:hypothetical protein [Gemella haemolysans]|uniref:hypothetical protein n=1 Tax=Gemella haemolysans TaxID=1379 RepID=UPI0028D89415|nr:hypothetical protein [Gemella haemolysans]